MRYRKPFTLEQRQDAIAIYRSLQVQLSRIRWDFRPRNHTERARAREFRGAVREFARAFAAKDAKVDVRRLNAAFDRATELGIQYAYLRNK
jgi:hypothetical protein